MINKLFNISIPISEVFQCASELLEVAGYQSSHFLRVCFQLSNAEVFLTSSFRFGTSHQFERQRSHKLAFSKGRKEGSREPVRMSPILDETLPDFTSTNIQAERIINQNKCSCRAMKREILKETSQESGLTDPSHKDTINAIFNNFREQGFLKDNRSGCALDSEKQPEPQRFVRII